MKAYDPKNIRKGDKAMQKQGRKQQNTLINSALNAVVGMFFAVSKLLHSQASLLRYRCTAR